MIKKIFKMRNVLAGAACLAVGSMVVGCDKPCDKNDPKSECYEAPPKEEPKVDTLGTCVVRFHNLSQNDRYYLYIDNKRIMNGSSPYLLDGGQWYITPKDSVRAGTRTIEAESQGNGQKKKETVLILTDDVFTLEFP